MNSGVQPFHNSDGVRSPELEIYLHARNTNLLWRYEILTANDLDPTEQIKKMEDDIFWDLAEIDRELAITKSLRLTNMGISSLPDHLTIPFEAPTLDLSGNQLTKIPEAWFGYMQNLRILRIANNQFQEVPWRSISQLTSLRIMDLRGNPWKQEFIDKFQGYTRMFTPHLQKIYW